MPHKPTTKLKSGKNLKRVRTGCYWRTKKKKESKPVLGESRKVSWKQGCTGKETKGKKKKLKGEKESIK